MKIFVAGATGATGRHLVKQLLDQGHSVRVVVRSVDRLPEFIRDHDNLHVITASLLNLSDPELSEHVKECDAVASCLGHNISFKGIYGKPRRLVTNATRRLCEAIKSNHPQSPVKFVLMNTSGNRNRDLNEPISFGQRIVIGLLRVLLPPHPDNEQAAEYLRTQMGQDDGIIEWVAVRPDGLIDEEEVSEYSAFQSPIRNPIFNAGKISRINVAHFMAELITNDSTWDMWKGQMPVIYNQESVISNQES